MVVAFGRKSFDQFLIIFEPTIFTFGLLFNAGETVEIDTRAFSATFRKVTFFFSSFAKEANLRFNLFKRLNSNA